MSLDSAQMAELVLNDLFDENEIFIEQKEEQNTPSESWVITVFNLLIEYIPYKHLMEEIFLCCNANLNDAIHSKLQYPNTSDLEHEYNYFDVPHLFIENVSTTHINQPSIVFMIGAPGSGKSSYANYRYGSENVFAADDYFDLYHDGNFVGSKLSAAHDWCTKQVFARIEMNKTVVIANTNSKIEHLHAKIVPILFDLCQIHKIVFAVMPEQNPSILVKRCLHKVPKLKINEYCKDIKYMLSIGGKNKSMNIEKILKYGHTQHPNDGMLHMIKSKENMIEYGIFLESETFVFLQGWFMSMTNCKYIGDDIGDGRISPLCFEHWHLFKEYVQKLHRDNCANDPMIELEIKIVGYAQHHSICKMVKIEIIQSSIKCGNKIEERFWNIFKKEVDLQKMGCVISMQSGFSFSNAKYCVMYDKFKYIEDGPIVKAKLTTKRRAMRRFDNGFTEKKRLNVNAAEFHLNDENNGGLNPNVPEFKMGNNEFLNPNASEFTYGECEEMEEEKEQSLDASAPEFVVTGSSKLKADAEEFNMAMEDKQKRALSPNAKEFKMQNSGPKMNVDAVEFEPNFLKSPSLNAAAPEFKLNGHS